MFYIGFFQKACFCHRDRYDTLLCFDRLWTFFTVVLPPLSSLVLEYDWKGGSCFCGECDACFSRATSVQVSIFLYFFRYSLLPLRFSLLPFLSFMQSDHLFYSLFFIFPIQLSHREWRRQTEEDRPPEDAEREGGAPDQVGSQRDTSHLDFVQLWFGSPSCLSVDSWIYLVSRIAGRQLAYFASAVQHLRWCSRVLLHPTPSRVCVCVCVCVFSFFSLSLDDYP